MSLLHPLWLWSLAALLLPLAIHLLSRKEGNIIRIGSIRHLAETSTQQFKGIRLNEILLLLLRAAMVILLCLLLAGLAGRFQPREKWVLAEAGTERWPQGRALIDSLTADGYELHRWGAGLPAWDASYANDTASYYQWMAALKEQQLAEAVVITWQYADGFRGPAVSVPDRIQIVTADISKTPFVRDAMRVGDSVRMRIGHPDAFGVRYETEIAPSAADTVVVSEQKKLIVQLVYDDTHKEQASVLVAAWRALSAIDWRVEVLERSDFDSQQKADWLVWMKEAPAPETEATLMTLARGAEENLITRISPRHFVVANVTSEGAYQRHLSVALVQTCAGRAHTPTPLPDQWAWSRENDDAAAYQATLAPWLLMAVLLLLGLERWISFKRKQ